MEGLLLNFHRSGNRIHYVDIGMVGKVVRHDSVEGYQLPIGRPVGVEGFFVVVCSIQRIKYLMGQRI